MSSLVRILPTSQHVRRSLSLSALAFGARSCTCSCSPCDCNPCECSDRRADFPCDWRFSGLHIRQGSLAGQDLRGLTVLTLALRQEQDQWNEIMLIDQHLPDTVLSALLHELRPALNALPAEIAEHVTIHRSHLAHPLVLSREGHRLYLDLHLEAHNWQYRGPVALRAAFPS